MRQPMPPPSLDNLTKAIFSPGPELPTRHAMERVGELRRLPLALFQRRRHLLDEVLPVAQSVLSSSTRCPACSNRDAHSVHARLSTRMTDEHGNPRPRHT